MKKKYVLTAMILLAMGLSACSAAPENNAASSGGAAEPRGTEAAQPGASGDENPENIAENGSYESLAEDEIMQGDPIVGIVDSFENDVIVIRDGADQDIIYYFSTQNAQVIEGDSPIAPGDVVEVTYKGVQGDEAQPGTAVKVVAESMMYNTEGEGQ